MRRAAGQRFAAILMVTLEVVMYINRNGELVRGRTANPGSDFARSVTDDLGWTQATSDKSARSAA